MYSSDLPGCRSQRRKHHPLHRLAAIWIVITLACQLPGQVVSTPPFAPSRTPAPSTATPAQATPATQQGSPPPALVEVRPLQGSQIRQDEGFTLTFSRPMNHAAVEASVQTNPALSGSFRWLDDNTVTFLPQTPLPADSSLTLTVSTAAQSLDGQPLARMVDLSFRTPPALALTNRTPEADAVEVEPQAAIRLAFNQPVGGGDSAAAFTLDPPVQGRGEWQSASAYAFYPEPGLRGGGQYTLTLDPALAARMGDGVETSWRFTARAPHLISTAPERQGLPLNPDVAFSFTFNGAVDRASFEDNFTLLGADGFPVHGSFQWSDNSSRVLFDPDVLLLRGTSYYLTLTNQVVSADGERFPELPYKAGYLIAGPPALVDAKPVSGGLLELREGRGQVALQLNVPLAEQPLAKRVVLEPAVDGLSLSAAGDTLTLSGLFQANTRYTVTLSPDLTDRWNKRLGESIIYTFQTTPAQPALTLPEQQSGVSLFARSKMPALTARVEDLSTLDVSTASLSLAEYLRLASIPSSEWQLPESRWESTWALAFTPQVASGPALVKVPLTEGGGPLQPGLYAVRIASPSLLPGKQPAPVLVVCADRYVSMRRDPAAAQVWAVSLTDATPVDGGMVELYDGQGSRIGSLKTGSNGLGRIESPELDLTSRLYAMLGQPGEAGFGLAVAGENSAPVVKAIQSASGESGKSASFLETDRPAYRPGETAHFRAYLSGSIESQTATVQVWQGEAAGGDGDKPLAEIPLSLSTFGTASGAYTLPLDLTPGPLTLSLAEQPEAAAKLRIVEQKQTGAQLSLSSEKQVVFPRQGLTVDASARTESGAPADGMGLTWRLLAFAEPDILPAGYQGGRVDWGWLEAGSGARADETAGMPAWREIATGSEETNLDGLAQIQVSAEKLAALPAGVSRWRLALEADLKAPDGTALAQAVMQSVYQPADIGIGIQADAGNPQAGELLGFSILSVAPGGSAKPAQALEAVFTAVSWDAGTLSDPKLESAKARPVMNTAGSVNFQTGADGLARVAFTPPSPGLYVLDVHSGGAVSQALVWVGGAGDGDWPDLPGNRLPLKLVGQGNGLFIPNPFVGTAQALVTVGAGDARSLSISGGGQVAQLTALETSAASETVSVTLVGQAADGTAGVLQGSIDLPAQPGLQIEMDLPPRSIVPGERLGFQLKARDAQGQPVQAEFSLALVDPAALSINNVDALAGPDQTVYWNGSLVTGADGQVIGSAQMTERSQSLKAVVRAVAADGQMAAKTFDFRTYSDLQLQPRLPGALTAGDHAALPMVVLNNTAQEWQGSVALDVTGLMLDPDSPHSQEVTVPAGGQAQVAWTGTVADANQVGLTFTAGDQTRPVELPVLRGVDAQAFTANGELTQEGERREVIALPPSMAGTTGDVRVEVAPSLAALVNAGLADIPAAGGGLTEEMLLSFAPETAAGQAWMALGLEPGEAQTHRLETAQQAIDGLAVRQNPDGGWGLWPSLASDDWTSSEVLISLTQAQGKYRLDVDPAMDAGSRNYIRAHIFTADAGTSAAELDRLALSLYALSPSGTTGPTADSLYEFREDLSPAGQAFLALALPANDERSRALVEGLEQTVDSSGAEQFWQGGTGSAVFDTAVVTYALGRLDPASPLLPDVVRYLLSRRGPDGNWSTSRESLWSWLALVEVVQGTADVHSEFAYTVTLDGAPIAQSDGSGDNSDQPATAQIALDQLNPQGSLLQVQRGAGSGRLYYHAGVRLYRPAETTGPVDRGIVVERQYSLEGQDCSGGCPALTSAQVGQTLLVRLSLTVPRDTNNLVVEDLLPAGVDFLDAPPSQQSPEAGLFGQPDVSNGRVRWMGASVPAGSYQLTYRSSAARAGEYRILPAQAYVYGNPDLGGSSAGAVIDVKN